MSNNNSIFFPTDLKFSTTLQLSDLLLLNNINDLQTDINSILIDISSHIDWINETSAFVNKTNIKKILTDENDGENDNNILDLNVHSKYYLNIFNQLNDYNLTLKKIQETIINNINKIVNNTSLLCSNYLSIYQNNNDIQNVLKPCFLSTTTVYNKSINISAFIDLLNKSIDNYRGTFDTIDDIPDDVNLYEKDLNGNTIPHKYDYIIIKNVFDRNNINIGKWKFIYNNNTWNGKNNWIKLYQISPYIYIQKNVKCDNLNVQHGTALCKIVINNKQTTIFNKNKNQINCKYENLQQLLSFEPIVDIEQLKEYIFYKPYFYFKPKLSFILIADKTGGSQQLLATQSVKEYSINESGWYKIKAENIACEAIDIEKYFQKCAGKTAMVLDILVNDILVDTQCSMFYNNTFKEHSIDRSFLANGKTVDDYINLYNQKKWDVYNKLLNADYTETRRLLLAARSANTFMNDIWYKRADYQRDFNRTSIASVNNFDSFNTTTYCKLLYLHKGDMLKFGITDDTFRKIKVFTFCAPAVLNDYEGYDNPKKYNANTFRYAYARFKYTLYKIT